MYASALSLALPQWLQICLVLGFLPFIQAFPSFHETAALINHHAPGLSVYAAYILLHTIYLNHEAIRLNYLYIAATNTNQAQAWLQHLSEWTFLDPELASAALVEKAMSAVVDAVAFGFGFSSTHQIHSLLDLDQHCLFLCTENVNYAVVVLSKIGGSRMCIL